MGAVLMDTNALVWFMNGDAMTAGSLSAIAGAQASSRLYVSPISAWEAALALGKRRAAPDLGGRDADDWFQAVLHVRGTRLAGVTARIALAAARVPALYGSGDPADCFLIATAHVRKLQIVTRDAAMLEFARRRPSYLKAIAC